MKRHIRISQCLCFISWFIQSLGARLPPLEFYGNQFFDSETGASVALKGVAYYPRPNDGPLNVNGVDFFHEEYRHVWEADIVWMKQLGINAVRIYAVDPSKDHDGFMCAMQEAGIYVLVGLSATCQGCSITMDPAPQCYSPDLKVRGMQVINHFSKYENLLGFDATNEVHLKSSVSDTGPCQRKFISDMRTFIAECDAMPRKIPLGLSFADRDRVLKINYYNCEEEPGDNGFPDWFGLNIYLDCNPFHVNVSESRAFEVLATDFENYSLPVLVTEFGCNNPQFPTIDGFEGQRNWRAARWLHEGVLRATFTGTFAFEFNTEAIWANRTGGFFPFQIYSDGDHGIGYYQPEKCNHLDIRCEYVIKPQFDFLRNEYAATPTVGTFQRDTYAIKSTARTICPPDIEPVSSFVWPSDDEPGLFCWDQSVDPCGTKPAQPTGTPSATPSTGMSPSVSPSVALSPSESPSVALSPSESPSVALSPSGSPSTASPSRNPSTYSSPSDTPSAGSSPQGRPTTSVSDDSAVDSSSGFSTMDRRMFLLYVAGLFIYCI